MDTRMIDVSIGLALLFALTSLLTTALQEVWTSWRGTRGKVLRQAIESFVGDDPRFAQALLDHPLLVSLSPQTQAQKDERRPSYIGADSVVSALIGQLVQTHAGGMRPTTPAELIDTVQRVATGQAGGAAIAGVATAVPGAQFARGLSALVIGVERDWPAFEARVAAWYDAVGERSTGWFKRKVQRTVFVFGLATAVLVNINPIVVASRLWEDEPLRKAVVSAAEKAASMYESPRPPPVPAADNPKPPASGALLTRDGAASAPKRALFPDLAAPLDDFKAPLVAALATGSANSQERVVLDSVATRFLDLRSAALAWRAASGANRAAAGTRVQGLLDDLLRGVPPPPAQQALHDSYQRLRTVWAQAQLPAPSATSVKPPQAPEAPASASSSAALSPLLLRQRECDQYTDNSTLVLCRRMNDLSALQQAGLPIGWSRAARPSVWEDGCGAVDDRGNARDAACQGGAPLLNPKWWGNSLLMLAGWLLTALACTLGAPFWFDVLGKLVKLRASGGKPDSGTDGGAPGATPAAGMLARTPQAATGATTAAVDETDRVPMSDALNDAERALVRHEIERLQRALGLSEPEVSGYFDGTTRRAIKAWEEKRTQSPSDGELSAAQIHELLALRPGGDDDGYLG